ncbi:MAG: 23S rRNA methyltransferase [Legionellales bacterium]|nr:23S rRNA methyltransferase [Legionellales bacterium]|tara:strand:+ start:1162 stop:1776 length:615 start_codon:yes stop_codon:yes gene_type:complete
MAKKDKNWMQRHVNDRFVQEANKEGMRSRASYKLLQIHERDKLFRPGMNIVDLGCAPGGWSQVAKQIVGQKGTVVGVDLLEMDPLQGVHFIKGDFQEAEVQSGLISFFDGPLDWVISDMAPNLTGHRAVDQPRAIALCEEVLYFAQDHLHPKGGLLIKTFHGEGFEEFLKMLRSTFKKVVSRKPEASRGESREVYLLAKEFKLV